MKTDLMIAGISVTILGIFIIMYWWFFDTNMTIQYGEEVVFVVMGIIAIGIVLTIFGYHSESDEKNNKDMPKDDLDIKKENLPMEVLKMRFAKGEITEEEYGKLKKLV